MNVVNLGGRLSADPKRSGTATFFNIAVNKKDGAEFLDVVAFGKLGDNILDYCHKGDPITAEGHLVTGDKEHDYKLSIIADRVEFMGGRKNG